jgi:hypothetical protein
MDERIQRKKAAPGAGLDLSGPKSLAKPKRTPEMERALQRSKEESQEFLTGVLSFRLEQDVLDQLMKQANAQGLSAGQLARSWIIERLSQSTVSGFSAEQTAQIKKMITEIAQNTLIQVTAEAEIAQPTCWTTSHSHHKGEFHWTSAGMFQHSHDIFSRKKAEGVVNHALSLLESVHGAGKPVEVPAPDFEILTSLACSALSDEESQEKR